MNANRSIVGRLIASAGYQRGGVDDAAKIRLTGIGTAPASCLHSTD
jgi:hypothetical protein